ncbi:hypothetical protein PHYBOEH_008879 [Phytophthora boehmeriae]|uniref:Uncharacterized protein n=1 Tax=Phytophthora boehmeriae TaxID=109152 RepID=A0A8T1VY44_9STRA|nr:hypothetical protein PHYBOEH_008879 [Phytophthora boehmeriae]
MRVILPAATTTLLLLEAQLSPATAKCFFGTFKCGDGASICLNPVTAAKCAFDAVCPIKLDQIVTTLGAALKVLTPDEVDFVIDLGVNEVNSVFADFRDCYKGFEGTVPKCQKLHTVHSCVSATFTAAKSLKASGKFAKLAATKLDKADKALTLMESTVLPALNKECGSGCLGEDSCPANTTQTSECTEEELTLTYSPPSGCTCLAATETAYDLDAEGQTIATCARNLAFYMTDQTPPLLYGKAYFPEMGCFVGKNTQNGCSSSKLLQGSELMFTNDMNWELNGLHNYYFIPCIDQYGRKYSEREQPVNKTTCLTTVATTTTAQTTSSASPLQGLSRVTTACYALLVTVSWWLIL